MGQYTALKKEKRNSCVLYKIKSSKYVFEKQDEDI